EVFIGAFDHFGCTIAVIVERPLVAEVGLVGQRARVTMVWELTGRGRRIAGPGGGRHARGENAHLAGRRRDAPGRPARNARGTAQAPRRAALSLSFLRAEPGLLPRGEGDVDRPPTRDEARARDTPGAAQSARGLVERLRVLTGR